MYNFEEIEAFVMDKKQTYKVFQDGKRKFFITKVPYNDDIAFLYGNEACSADVPVAFGMQIDCLGAAHYPSKTIYGAGSTFMFRVTGFTLGSLDDLVKRAETAVQKKIVELVADKPVAVTETATEKPYDNMAYFTEHTASHMAQLMFYKGETYLRYSSEYSISRYDAHTDMYVKMICNLDKFAVDTADAYIKKHALQINDALKKIPIVQERLDALYEKPGQHTCRLAISRSIGDHMKYVQVMIEIDGKTLCVRYEAFVLQSCNAGDAYYSHRMDAPSRREFIKTYGSSKYVYPRDIISISYCKKEIYRREDAN
jgi:hypothetical protein